MRALYFGVESPRSLGHYMFEAAPAGRMPGMYKLRYHSEEAMTPWGETPDGNLAPRPRAGHGIALGVTALHHKDGWTGLSFWDRSGDSRPGSSSTFLFDANLTFDQALAAARERFPFLFERFSFEVVPVSASDEQREAPEGGKGGPT